ncbi:MAG: hypothetical protein ACRDJU_03470 [Actinomycetota bacterium]
MRVAAWTGGSIIVVTTVAFVLVFRQNGSGWGSAVLQALPEGFVFAVVGIGGFMISAPRCPRCRAVAGDLLRGQRPGPVLLLLAGDHWRLAALAQGACRARVANHSGAIVRSGRLVSCRQRPRRGSWPASPDAALAAELRLPYPATAVFFGSDLAIPAELTGGEQALDRRRRLDDPSDDKAQNPPTMVRPGVLALRKRQPVALSGVVRIAGDDGAVSDFALFIVRTPESSIYGNSFVEGRLSRSRLAPLITNLAAAVAWGDWTRLPRSSSSLTSSPGSSPRRSPGGLPPP